MKLNKYTGTFVCRALSGIDTALWDLAAKVQGKSVAAMLQAPSRRVPIYASNMLRETTPEQEIALLKPWRDEAGVTAFKIKLGPMGAFGSDADSIKGAAMVAAEALVKMQALSTRYAMGLSIDQVQLKNINPPVPVQESFNEVNQAQQEKEKLINEARRDYNKVIPLAEGEKDQRIREADGYRLKRINEAEGDVARFNSLLAEYSKAPEVTRRRIYVETLQEVMPGIRSKIIVDEQTQSILPLLNLGSLGGDRP